MSSYSRTVQWVVWGGLAAVIVVITGAFVRSRLGDEKKLPIVPALPVYSQISDFALTNQFGKAVSFADLRGQVWLADIIFTRCPGPCTAMTKRMVAFQNALPAGSPLKLVSLTTDPEFDTPPVLKAYGEKFGAQPERWSFLTGSKSEIRKLAIDGLKLVLMDKKPEDKEGADDLFIHSTIFVLVDRKGQVRATMESDQPEAQGKMLQALQQVLNEKTP